MGVNIEDKRRQIREYDDTQFGDYSSTGMKDMTAAGEWGEVAGGWETGAGRRDIMSQFGLGGQRNIEKYQKYITGFQQTPFELMKKQALGSLEQQQYESSQGLADVGTKVEAARSKTGFAFSGATEGGLRGALTQAAGAKRSGRQQTMADWEQRRFGEQQKQISQFYDDIGAVVQMKAQAQQAAAAAAADSGCVVTSTLNSSGAWTSAQKNQAVNWCNETHHDGSKRGKTWVKGYHTWGKVLSKYMKKSRVVKYIADVTTDAFMDVVKRNKPNYLGYIIHYGWINPLSYIIGYSKNNKVLGGLAIFLISGLYTTLFPLFGLISIPYAIKRYFRNKS